MGIDEFLLERKYKAGYQQGVQFERLKAEKENLEIARELKKYGLTNERIAYVMKLSIDQIKEL